MSRFLSLTDGVVLQLEPEYCTFRTYTHFPNRFKDKYSLTRGRAGFDLRQNSTIDLFLNETKILETFEGIAIPDVEELLERKYFTLPEWEDWLDLVHVPLFNWCVPRSRVAIGFEQKYQLIWYEPGKCYLKGPGSHLKRELHCKSVSDEPNTWAWDRKGSERPPRNWYSVVNGQNTEENPYEGKVSLWTEPWKPIPREWFEQVRQHGNYDPGRSVDPPDPTDSDQETESGSDPASSEAENSDESGLFHDTEDPESTPEKEEREVGPDHPDSPEKDKEADKEIPKPTEKKTDRPQPVVPKVIVRPPTPPTPGGHPDLDPVRVAPVVVVPPDPGAPPPVILAGVPAGPDPDPTAKMTTNKPPIKDVPLFKEGEDPTVFTTSFTAYLNYYDIDPDNVDLAGLDDAEKRKTIKEQFTNSKTLFGRAMQGRAASWFLDNVNSKDIRTSAQWKDLIKLFNDEFALDGQTTLGRVVQWHSLRARDFDTFLDFIREVQKRGRECGHGEAQQVELIKSLANNDQIAAIANANADSVTKIISAIRDMKIREKNTQKMETPSFMAMSDGSIVNQKLEAQGQKLEEVCSMVKGLCCPDGTSEESYKQYDDRNGWRNSSRNWRGGESGFRGRGRGFGRRGYRNNWNSRGRFQGGFNYRGRYRGRGRGRGRPWYRRGRGYQGTDTQGNQEQGEKKESQKQILSRLAKFLDRQFESGNM